MAGEKHLPFDVDYPPLPSVNQKQTNNPLISISLDRNQNISAAQAHNSTSLENLNSLNMIIGSIVIPPVPNPMNHQKSIQHKMNRVDTAISKPSPPLVASHKDTVLQPRLVHDSNHQDLPSSSKHSGDLRDKVIAPVPTSNSLDNSKQGGDTQGVRQNASHMDCSNLAKAFLGKLELQPCHQILGKNCVSFTMEDKKSLLSTMNYIIVVKFSHFRPKFNEFNSFMLNMKFLGNFRIFEFDLKHVFVEFLVFEDFIKFWMMKSCVIGGFRGRLFQWDSDFMPSFESSIAPIWVHLPDFPLYLFNEQAILSVASVFGKPIYINPASLKHQKVGKLSMCVAKDVRLKCPNEILVEFVGDGILVERFSQKVNYGEILDFCSRCLHMGHCMIDCKVVDGLNKVLGSLSSRLKDGEVGDIDTVIPIVSIFDRINENMQVKDKEGELTVIDKDTTVLVEDVCEGDDEMCGSGHSTTETPKINEQVHFSDSSTAHTMKPSISVSDTVEHVLVAGTSSMLQEVDNRSKKTVDIDPEANVIMDATLADVSKEKITNPDSYTDSLLKANNSIPGVVEQGLLVGDITMLSKDDVQVDNVMESGGEEHVIAADKSVDGSIDSGMWKTSSDSSVAPSLKSFFSNPGAEVKGLLAGVDSFISKVDIRIDKDLDTYGDDIDMVSQTSVDEPIIADMSLSMALNTTSTRPPSSGSLEGTSGDVIRWLRKQVGLTIQDNLQQQILQQGDKVDSSSAHKIVIRDPVSKEIVHLSPKTKYSSTTAPISPVAPNKNTQKKAKKKKKQKNQTSFSAAQDKIELIADSDSSFYFR